MLEQPISSNILITVLDELANALGLVPEARRQRTAQRWIHDLAIKASNPENPVEDAVGRQPAARRACQVDGDSAPPADPRQPDGRRRHRAKDGIYEVVRALAARGVAILLISDEIPEVFYHSHRVLVMRRGRLAGECIPGAASEEELQAVVDA